MLVSLRSYLSSLHVGSRYRVLVHHLMEAILMGPSLPDPFLCELTSLLNLIRQVQEMQTEVRNLQWTDALKAFIKHMFWGEIATFFT